jgi:hypothetical protein
MAPPWYPGMMNGSAVAMTGLLRATRPSQGRRGACTANAEPFTRTSVLLRFRASKRGQHFHVAQYQFPFIEPSDWITGVLMSTPVEPWPG